MLELFVFPVLLKINNGIFGSAIAQSVERLAVNLRSFPAKAGLKLSGISVKAKSKDMLIPRELCEIVVKHLSRGGAVETRYRNT
jgi:hypothetical protein